MKKVNFLRKALIVIFSFIMFNVVVAQQIGTTSIFVVLDSTAVYNRGIPKYGLLFSTETGRLWQANQYTAGTNSLSTTSKTEITSKHAFADSIALLPAQWRSDISDSIVATHPTLAELLEENNDAGDTTITGLRGFGNMSISSGNFGIAHNGGTLKNNSLGVAFNGGSLDESLGVAFNVGSLTNNSSGVAFNGGTLDNSSGFAFNVGSLTNNSSGVAFNNGTLDNGSGFAFNGGSLTNDGLGVAFSGGSLTNNSSGFALDRGSLDTSSLGIVFNSTYFKRNTGFSDSYKDSLINGSISSFSGSLNKFENSSQQKGTAKGVLLASDTSNITNSNNFVGINLQNRTYTDKHNTTVIDRNLMLPGIDVSAQDSVLYIAADGNITKGPIPGLEYFDGRDQNAFSIGIGAFSDTGGGNNLVIGNNALGSAINVGDNTILGTNACATATNVHAGVIIGNDAAKVIDGAGNSVIIGAYACYQSTGGTSNVVIGTSAFKKNNGNGNTIIGNDAVTNNTEIMNNTVIIGNNAGNSAGGNNCIIIGTNADGNGGDSEIVIGAGALGKGANTTVIGTPLTTKTYLEGTLILPDLDLSPAPSSATDTGTKGEIRITATHIYVCVGTDTWVRSELTTW